MPHLWGATTLISLARFPHSSTRLYLSLTNRNGAKRHAPLAMVQLSTLKGTSVSPLFIVNTMLQSDRDFYEDVIVHPSKRQKLLCDEPSSPIYPEVLQQPSHFEDHYSSPGFIAPPPAFEIKWNEHPEEPVAFPATNWPFHPPGPYCEYPVMPVPLPIETCVPKLKREPDSLHQEPPSPVHNSPPTTPYSHGYTMDSISKFLSSIPAIKRETEESLGLKSSKAPLPDSIDTVVRLLSSYEQASLSIEGPYNSTWFITGLSHGNLNFLNLKEVVESLFSKCRTNSNINSRFSMYLESKSRTTIGDHIKGRLWDVTPEKIATDIYNLFTHYPECIQADQPALRMTVHHQEPAVKLMSDNDVKKKRSIITIDERKEASLIYGFYVAVRRNAIVRQKKATRDPKRRKELENQLTNIYRKGKTNCFNYSFCAHQRSRIPAGLIYYSTSLTLISFSLQAGSR